MSSLPAPERARLLAGLTDAEAAELEWDWGFWARPAQLPPPGSWHIWLVMAGRGFGKTRTGAEWVRAEAEAGRAGRIALVAETAADARDVMVEGPAGILAVSRPTFRPKYEPSKRRLTWPNGAVATTYSADDPEQLRGPQHDRAWADEIAKWRYATDTWDNLMFGLRLGDDPLALATTTPRPVALVRQLLAQEGGAVAVTRGGTRENAANLAPTFLSEIMRRYQGTRLGRQELDGEMLDDVPGALWTRGMIEAARADPDTVPDLVRVVVAIDPAMTSGDEADETGMIIAGRGPDDRAYVLDDISCRLSPDGWARRAVNAYRAHLADRIVAEVNNGGDLVEQTIRTVDLTVSYTAVRASRGKRVRAEPVAALYEQGRVSHLVASPALEDQMCTFVPDDYAASPDRLDALVWALTNLMLDEAPEPDIW